MPIMLLVILSYFIYKAISNLDFLLVKYFLCKNFCFHDPQVSFSRDTNYYILLSPLNGLEIRQSVAEALIVASNGILTKFSLLLL